MKQYVVDQLRESDYFRILDYLKEKAEATEFEDIFWVLLPEEMYSDVQKEHAQCRPFYFAVTVTYKQVEFELLIRSRQVMRCSCVGYANRKQRDFILDFTDRMLEELEIRL